MPRLVGVLLAILLGGGQSVGVMCDALCSSSTHSVAASDVTPGSHDHHGVVIAEHAPSPAAVRGDQHHAGAAPSIAQAFNTETRLSGSLVPACCDSSGALVASMAAARADRNIVTPPGAVVTLRLPAESPSLQLTEPADRLSTARPPHTGRPLVLRI